MKGFGAKVIANDVYQDEKAAEELGFEYVELDELLAKSDIISLHCPLTDDNIDLINDETIDKMKKGVIIINTSRGKLIDSSSLIKGLESEKIRGVGLDVFDEEADFFMNDMSMEYKRNQNLSVLLSMPNVIITSHQAFFTREALNKIAEVSMDNIKEYFEEGTCVNEVK